MEAVFFFFGALLSDSVWRDAQPPAGCHSVVAQGQTDPDPKGNRTLKFDGKRAFFFSSFCFGIDARACASAGHDVVVPAGKPIERAQYKNSSFSQTEWLVYQVDGVIAVLLQIVCSHVSRAQESQVRIRYLLKCKF